MAGLIEEARTLGIKTIFVQPQFSRKTASVLAEALGARVRTADPLAEDLFLALQTFAMQLAEEQG